MLRHTQPHRKILRIKNIPNMQSVIHINKLTIECPKEILPCNMYFQKRNTNFLKQMEYLL